MTTVLLCTDEAADELERDLIGAGLTVTACCEPSTLLRDAVRSHASVIVARHRQPAASLLPALAALREHAPVPVLLFTTDTEVTTLAAALDAGVDAMVVHGYAAARLRPLLQLAQLRFDRDRRGRDELRLLAERFEERKLVDRAKGILMVAGQLDEEEAFRLLRVGSMRLKRRVGLVSQQVIEASGCAQALNVAGLLRMLSQRVMLHHALKLAQVESQAAQREVSLALARAEAHLRQLDKLLSISTYGDLLDTARGDWRHLAAAVDGPGIGADLPEIDLHAEACLESADRLGAALQAAGYGGEPHVVNICGRQRMLSQRLAKQALLKAVIGGGRFDQGIDATVAEFERALVLLQAAPLGDMPLREGLRTGVDAWAALRGATTRLDELHGRLALASQSEVVLHVFDDLTGRYERSLDLLIG